MCVMRLITFSESLDLSSLKCMSDAIITNDKI